MEQGKNNTQQQRILSHKGSLGQANAAAGTFGIRNSAEDCDYWCNCSVCKGLENARKRKTTVNFSKVSEDNQERFKENLVAWGGRNVSFTFILERLVSVNAKIKGCPVAIPETILFHQSRPKCIFRFDKKDNEIIRINARHLMQLPYLMKMMMHEYRQRKRGSRTSRRSGELESSPRKKTEEGITNFRGGVMAVVRYISKENASLLSETEFLELMMERSGSKIWAEILSIQNYIVTPKSPAEILIYKYNAPINYSDPEKEVLKNFAK